MRTMMNNTTALVGREFVRYEMEIAALSETRLEKVEEIKEVSVVYTFVWGGSKVRRA